MEAQLHHTHVRPYNDPLYPAAGTEENQHGGEEHEDEAEIVNNSPAVRSGLMEPTVMGTPVLAEDLHATHSDIVDPPTLSTGVYGAHLTNPSKVDHHVYGQQVVNREQSRGSIGRSTHLTDRVYGQEVNKEQSRGNIGKSTGVKEEDPSRAPPPPSTGINGSHLTVQSKVGGHHVYGEEVSMEQPRGNIGKSAGMEEVPSRAPPPTPSIGIYGSHPTDQSKTDHHVYDDQEVNKEQFRGSIGKSTGMEEDPSAPKPTAVSPANYQTKVTDPTNTGGKEIGIEVLHPFNKMGVYDEPDTKSLKSDQNKPEVYTGSHDQFTPETVKKPPVDDTIADDSSSRSSSHTQKITSATSAIADKATAAKDMIVSKLISSGTGSPATATVKEYVVDTFKPREDDKELSEVITHAFHRPGKGNAETSSTTTTTTAYVIVDEGERRLQDSGN